MPPTSSWSYAVLGGALLGFWLVVAFNPEAARDTWDQDWNNDAWVTWGLLGIVIGAAFYASRITSDNTRIAIWVFTGLFLGGLVALSVLQQTGSIIATFLTGTGALLLAAGLPPYPDAMQPAPQPRAPSGPAQPPADPYGGWTQTQPSGPGSQQQGVTVIHRPR